MSESPARDLLLQLTTYAELSRVATGGREIPPVYLIVRPITCSATARRNSFTNFHPAAEDGPIFAQTVPPLTVGPIAIPPSCSDLRRMAV